jgi:hypothetical protein
MDWKKWKSLIEPDNDFLVMLEPTDTKHPRYSKAVCLLMNLVSSRAHCSYGCHWVAPYGFVRNATCPWHG